MFMTIVMMMKMMIAPAALNTTTYLWCHKYPRYLDESRLSSIHMSVRERVSVCVRERNDSSLLVASISYPLPTLVDQTDIEIFLEVGQCQLILTWYNGWYMMDDIWWMIHECRLVGMWRHIVSTISSFQRIYLSKMDLWIDGWIDEWMDRWMDRWIDEWIDG